MDSLSNFKESSFWGPFRPFLSQPRESSYVKNVDLFLLAIKDVFKQRRNLKVDVLQPSLTGTKKELDMSATLGLPEGNSLLQGSSILTYLQFWTKKLMQI